MRKQSLGRRLLFPVLERAFTDDRYERLLERLADSARYRVVRLCEFGAAEAREQAVVGLRHDVDDRLESALRLARLEHRHGLRSTYFVLHTAAYWHDPSLILTLRALQDDLGHEIGWHNDLVTLQCVYGIDARAYLARELGRLREGGLRIHGVASHGSPYCYRLGYHNNYFFADFPEEVPGFPNTSVVRTDRGECTIEKAHLADFGFYYEAYHLDNGLYFSDSTFNDRGVRWHPDELDPPPFRPGEKAIILIHPCHWDPSVAAKTRRLLGILASRLVTLPLRRSASLGAPPG